MTEPELQLVELGAVFPSGDGPPIEVLRNVNLAVGAGELVAVVGRSGSGKTTLLNIAGALMRPTEGRVDWQGTDITSLSPAEISRLRRLLIGYVFQGAGLLPQLTAQENVALPGFHGTSVQNGYDRSVELLRMFELGTRVKHFPAELSAGEQQRVGFARALFTGAPILLIDEPTASLDRQTADQVVAHMQRLAAAGKALLVATHDPGVIGVATRIFELEAA